MKRYLGSSSVHLNLSREGSIYVFISPFTGQKLKSGYFDHSGNGYQELVFSG